MANTKYDFEVSSEVLLADTRRLTNQLWKLIPMRENEENWKEQLVTVLLEIVGLKSLFFGSTKFLILITKLEGLREEDVDFAIYRKTVFEAISLLNEIYREIVNE